MSTVTYLVFLCFLLILTDGITCQNDKLDIGFFLYTRMSKIPQSLRTGDEAALNASFYNANHKTVIVIHGFLDNIHYTSWGKRLMKELLRYGNFNVILVDWSKHNHHFYTEVVRVVPLVGKAISKFIKFLQESTGTDPQLFHLIGHSLGAHVAGYAGKVIPNLRRITGLDPAGPDFEDISSSQRLDKSDAQFVDVIHTDASRNFVSGLGIKEVIGHADFFPNGGTSQPGCFIDTFLAFLKYGISEGLSNLLGCDHSRGIDMFISSINNKGCLPVGIRCRSWRSFRRGRCGDCGEDDSKCAVMGFHADNNKAIQNGDPHVFFLKTTSHPPYCYNHYQIKIELAQSSNQSVGISGLYMVVHGSENSERITLREGFDLLRGSGPFPYLMTTEKQLGKLTIVEFRWVDDSYYHYPPFESRKNEPPQFYLRKIRISPITSKQFVYYFCGDPEKSLVSNKIVVLYASTSCRTKLLP